jgi:myosin heavy subunit
MMPEKPTKDANGNLIAKFDILDTPNGRIAYTLAKYGYKLGISSRGGGDVYTGNDGNEHVDESTYDFQGFDLVLLPAVKAARLRMVESLQNGKTFKAAINEALENANADEKKVMQETLNNLNIEYTHEGVIDKSDIAANDVGADMIKNLQESLLAKEKAEAQVLELQEKLSVCYAKEMKYEEELTKYKQAILSLSEKANNAKALQTKIDSLNEELIKKDSDIEKANTKLTKILEKQDISISRQNNLTETISAKTKEFNTLTVKYESLTESFKQLETDSNSKIEQLTESLEESKKNLQIKQSEYNTKLSNANKLVEQYRATAKKAVNKYIESQALRLGVTAEEVKNKLPENYSFADIDRVCEGLTNFKLKVSNLPFNLEKQPSKIAVKESYEPIKPKSRFDDEVDPSLLALANSILK